MLGCFNPILGKIWTNPAITFTHRLYTAVTFLNDIFNTHNGWVKTTQHFLQCVI